MRLPSFTPPARPRAVTLDQLRERLARVIKEDAGHWMVEEGVTLRTAIENRIADMEISAGLRGAPNGPI